MRDSLRWMINADVGFEDITTNALIPKDLVAQGRIIANENGIIAGVDTVSDLFQEFGVNSLHFKNDGDKIKVNDIIMEIRGNARCILTLERTALNLLMRMSGIATLTFNTLEKLRKVDDNIILASTRKVTPGLQFFEKTAVKMGGGDTHRFKLDDCVLIKDNHIELVGSIEDALIMAKKNVSFTKKIEIEVENVEDALIAIKSGADIVLLDNMSSNDIKHVLNYLESTGLRDKAIIEVSGGIKPDNIVEYAKTGADVISAGFLIHSAKALDLSLEIF